MAALPFKGCRAAKEPEDLPSVPLRRRAVAIIRGLADNPRPQGSIKLAGSTDACRVLFGRHRILYSASDRVRVFSIEQIAHRKEAYR